MQIRIMRDFLRLESSAGILLFSAAILALVVDNTPLTHFYHLLLSTRLSLQLGTLIIGKPLLMWINEGLMTLFFLLVGLEIKREMLEGELNSLRKATLPVLAAIGGMLGPALIYAYMHWGDPVVLRGWAIPTATDIAFSLGILALLGSRIPVSLKIFLTALAIFDDIGGIAIIAGYYTQHIAMSMLISASALIIVLFILNRLNITARAPYFLVGSILWFCVLKSGVHATLSGIVIAMMIPLRDKRNPQHSPLRELEHTLHPWVAFLILPVFAFANAGISFADMQWHELWQPIALAIALGLFFGKQIGVMLFSWLGVACGLAKKPHGATWLGIYGMAMISGVGFTMSLFIGGLAFDPHLHANYSNYVRLGVIEGSLLSGICGYLVLRLGRSQSNTMLQCVPLNKTK